MGQPKFVQVDISPAGGRQQRPPSDAPLVGDGRFLRVALLAGIGSNWPSPSPASGSAPSRSAKTRTSRRMAETWRRTPTPMNFHSALAVVATSSSQPDAIMVNEGANALDFTAASST